MKHTQYRAMGQARMTEKIKITPNTFDNANTSLDHLGSTINTDAEFETALMQLCGQADSAEGAKEVLQAMNYLPYQQRSLRTASGGLRHNKTAPVFKPSKTNGYLERRNV